MRTEWPAGKTLLRDTALALFAERGPDAVSVRDVAAAAGVSPGLVVHHFGTKLALRQAVDDHVTAVFQALLDQLPSALDLDGEVEPDAAMSAGFAGLLLEHVPPESPIPAYLRRLLVSGDDGRDLFRRWYAATLEATGRWVDAGVLRAPADLAVRAAFLMVNDMAVFLLRDHLTDVLGVDPMGPDGVRRWTADVVAAYVGGVIAEAPVWHDDPDAPGTTRKRGAP